jgi:hypothetical protein
MPKTPLKLLAEDGDDLKVIAAALQDAVVKVGDVVFDPRARTLTIALNRFRWESGRKERVRAALQLGGVLNVRTRRIRRDAREAVMELLTVSFEPGEAPGGVVNLTFAGGGDLQADVEALDAALADVSEPWPARAAPRHQGV